MKTFIYQLFCVVAVFGLILLVSGVIAKKCFDVALAFGLWDVRAWFFVALIVVIIYATIELVSNLWKTK